MAQIFTNNARGTLAAPLGAADTTITLAAGHSLPVLHAGDHFVATLAGIDSQSREENAWEIVRVTATGNDTLTVERAQEGTAALDWATGTPISIRETAAALTEFAAKDFTDEQITELKGVAQHSEKVGAELVFDEDTLINESNLSETSSDLGMEQTTLVIPSPGANVNVETPFSLRVGPLADTRPGTIELQLTLTAATAIAGQTSLDGVRVSLGGVDLGAINLELEAGVQTFTLPVTRGAVRPVLIVSGNYATNTPQDHRLAHQYPCHQLIQRPAC